MKITCWNVNGLRSPSMALINNKQFNTESNLYKLISEYNPDILCFGETKVQTKNEDTFNDLLPFKYNIWNSSKKKLGYSGVCVFSKHPFKNLGHIPGLEDDNFGRNILLEFDKFILCHVYTPNSGGDKDIYRNDWDNHIYIGTEASIGVQVVNVSNLEDIHLVNTIKPDEIYNLAAQSHVAVSFEEP